MTWRSLIVMLWLVGFAGVAAAQDQRGLSDQQIFLRLEEDWEAAVSRNDVAAVGAILADEYMSTYDDGSEGDKARELELVRTFNQRIDESTIHDFSVRTYGDTAVVRFARRMVGPRNGVRHEVTFRYVDVFVWRDGRWQCVTSQSTRVSPR
ncbi:MAG: nuclear transport factor 2 family protein [Vicinamibacterales bacterium]